jgi:endonuclease/exonuclease/phosphatase family metal-dependent hydrolase
LKRIINRFILFFNILLALLLVLSHLAVIVDPQKIWQIAFLGLAYPYLLIANTAIILYWLILKRKEFLISFIAIISGWNILTSVIQLNFGFTKEDQFSKTYTRSFRSDNQVLKVLTYNVRAFNLYNWVNFEEAKDSIFRFILHEDPDIICFQEYYSQERGAFTSADLYRLLSKTPYRHIHYTIGENRNTRYGIATFSSFPIVGSGVIRFNNTINVTIYTDIDFNGDTLRIFNNHLQSIHLNRRNYAFIDSLRLRYSDQQLQDFLDISFRLKDAYIKRAEQAEIISGYIARSPYRVIVCGDFNDTPVSFTYKKMKFGLADSFIEAGSGLGNSYSGSFPSFRIDFILHSPELNALYTRRTRLKLSDHYPLVTYLRID